MLHGVIAARMAMASGCGLGDWGSIPIRADHLPKDKP